MVMKKQVLILFGLVVCFSTNTQTMQSSQTTEPLTTSNKAQSSVDQLAQAVEQQEIAYLASIRNIKIDPNIIASNGKSLLDLVFNIGDVEFVETLMQRGLVISENTVTRLKFDKCWLNGLLYGSHRKIYDMLLAQLPADAQERVKACSIF